MHLPQNRERGQVFILLMIGLVGLIGCAVLAIDGGMVLADRRQAQNAADTAALAGAYAELRGQAVATAAQARAADNGFDNNRTTNWVDVHQPPIDGPAANLPDKNNYIQVKIKAKVDTSLAHLVFPSTLYNQVEAVVHLIPGETGPLFNGNALVSLAPTGCKRIWSHGGPKTKLVGGGIFVNSNNPTCALETDGNPGEIETPSLTVVGGMLDPQDVATVDPGPADLHAADEAIDWPPALPITAPTCPTAAVKNGSHLSPGAWTGSFPPAGVETLDPGVYCIDGDFSMSGNRSISGTEVFLYIKNGHGLTINGTVTVNLSAPTSGDYKGYLFFFDPQGFAGAIPNGSEVKLNGTSSSSFVGTIYAPTRAVTLTGTGNTETYHSQVIGYNVTLGGNADLGLNYTASENAESQELPSVEVWQ